VCEGHGRETKTKAIVSVEVENLSAQMSLQEGAVRSEEEEQNAEVARPKTEERKIDVEEPQQERSWSSAMRAEPEKRKADVEEAQQETRSFLAQYTDDWERSLRTDIQHFSELNEISPDAWVLANFDKNGTKIDTPQMIPKDRELWPITFVFARRRTDVGLEVTTSSGSCEHVAKRRRSSTPSGAKDEEAIEPWKLLKTLCTMSRMGGA